MSALQVFDFEDVPVRVVECEGIPWFVAADVCRVLELSNPTMAIEGLDEDEKMTLSNPEGQAGKGAQSFNVISESGLYALVFKSRKPNARMFRKWVTAVVLPAIREDGVYVAPQAEDVPHMTVLKFIEQRGPEWPLDRQIEFGLKVRTFAKAMGVAFAQVSDPRFGRVLSHPVLLLERVAVALRLCRGALAYDAVGALLKLVDETGLAPWKGTAAELEEELRLRMGTRGADFCRRHAVARLLAQAAQDTGRVQSRRSNDARRWQINTVSNS